MSGQRVTAPELGLLGRQWSAQRIEEHALMVGAKHYFDPVGRRSGAFVLEIAGARLASCQRSTPVVDVRACRGDAAFFDREIVFAIRATGRLVGNLVRVAAVRACDAHARVLARAGIGP